MTSRPRSMSANLVDDASGERYNPATRMLAARTTSAESSVGDSNASTIATNVLAILFGTSGSNSREQDRINITPTDHSYSVVGCGQQFRMEKPCGGCNGTARFGDGLGITGKKLCSLHDFVLGNRDDIVHVAADVLERHCPDVLGAQTVSTGGKHLLDGKCDDVAGAQAGLGVSSDFGLDADNLGGWLGGFDRG